MAITPDTNVFLLKSPLQLSNKNQLTFNNKNEQFTYFYNLPKIEIEKANYQRKDNIIRFPAHIDTILEFNYCMYQNSNYGDKWFYAYITNMRYVSNNNTEITIVTDVFQTWQFDFNFKESFVEREMISVNDDIAGANLEPEGLEMGELVIEGTADIEDLEPRYIVAFTGDHFGETEFSSLGYSYNGLDSSITFIVTNVVNVALGIINEQGDGDKILTVFAIPKLAVKDFVEEIEGNDPSERVYYATPLPTYKQQEIIKTFIARPNSIDNYTPRNKKLLTYPYLYLGFNPANGTKKIFRYEDFTNATPKFKVISEINPNPSIYFIPQDYRGKANDNLSDACSMNGYPTISYKNDVYNTWLAQNSNIISLQMQQEQYNYEIDAYQRGANFGGNILDKALNLDIGGALMEGSNLGFDLAKMDVNHEYYIKMQMAQIEKQSMLPDNASLSSSNATLLGYNLIDNNIFTRYSIKNQFAKKIDKYFDMYGYLTNERKIPNLKNRPTWNYIKTIGANILGNIPQADMEILKNMFNQGITLWHNSENFLDYSINNR